MLDVVLVAGAACVAVVDWWAVAADRHRLEAWAKPATMALLGRANWWLPTWLDRVLPHLSIETHRSVESEGRSRGQVEARPSTEDLVSR